MIDRQALLSDLQKLLKKLEADLLERSESAEVPEVGDQLRREFEGAKQAERTAQSYSEWRSDQITQTAAAWVISCVFVRFLEDNRLIDPPVISGPGKRLLRARDEYELFFRAKPTLNDRDYLIAVFDGLESYPATKEVFGPHNPIGDVPNWLSGDAAGAVITFFQRIDPNTGALVHDFMDSEWDTRFLGDLYQDLSEAARKKYALLQTPVFVEEFILDRTLDPAIDEFGLSKVGYENRLLVDGRLAEDDRFLMIDPACGSGHFLLGSLARLLDRWRRKEPGTKVSVLAQRAFDSVHGVDLNPYAVAIARFRLLLAAMKECGVVRLKDAPGFEIHVACGDSLLHGSPGGDQLSLGWSSIDHVYQPEDKEVLDRLLRPRRYQSVVANPPYNTPKDVALNAAYRERYTTCHMKYSMGVPFMERIVSLAIEGGYTGQITANSFMKREFGKKLIEMFFAQLDLAYVIDTSGLSFGSQGFGGVPTVILFVRNRKPVARTIRTIMGIRGEPGNPDDPARGLVWSAILRQLDVPGSKSEFVNVADFPRETFKKHPWSIGGGGAAELKLQIEENVNGRLDDLIVSSGFMAITGEDDIFVAPARFWDRCVIPHRPFGAGDSVRDWRVQLNEDASFMYLVDNNQVALQPLDSCGRLGPLFWSYRINLRNRLMFGKLPEQSGLAWYEYRFKSNDRLCSPLLIVFAELSTHNRFVLERSGTVFKQTAPVISLERGASEDRHLALLGALNSSTACFWMKQVFQNKGSSVDQHGTRQTSVAFENYWQLDSTKLKQCPLPDDPPAHLARELDDSARRLQELSPQGLLGRWQSREIAPGGSDKDAFNECEREWLATREHMIAIQDDSDWDNYRHYGLIEEDLTQSRKAAKENRKKSDAIVPAGPPIQLGQRAFEIVMARKMAARELTTTWFERHHSTPITELPSDWPDDYRKLVERRIELIESNPNIRLIEQPEYKRRWNTESWESQLERAFAAGFWTGSNRTSTSTAG